MNTAARPDVVAVGYDGSDASRAAVDWAAAEAGRRGANLLLVTVVETPDATSSYLDSSATVPTGVVDRAHRLAATARGQALGTLPTERVSTTIVEGSPAGHLLKVSEAAALLVVGNTQRGSLSSLVAGSVSFPIAAHAHCPVVLVPDPLTENASGSRAVTSRGVVVGVDGSPQAAQALTVAAEMAQRDDASLTVVSAWDIPVSGAWTNNAWADGGTEQSWGEALRDDATDIATTAVAGVHESHPELAVSLRVVEAPAARAIVEAGDDASLVVVGSRGRGGFASLVLGSVSHAVLHDCAAPVMIVR